MFLKIKKNILATFVWTVIFITLKEVQCFNKLLPEKTSNFQCENKLFNESECLSGFCYDAINVKNDSIKSGCAEQDFCKNVGCFLNQKLNLFICCCDNSFCNGKSYGLIKARWRVFKNSSYRSKESLNLKRLLNAKNANVTSLLKNKLLKKFTKPVKMYENVTKNVTNENFNKSALSSMSSTNIILTTLVSDVKNTFSNKKNLTNKSKTMFKTIKLKNNAKNNFLKFTKSTYFSNNTFTTIKTKILSTSKTNKIFEYTTTMLPEYKTTNRLKKSSQVVKNLDELTILSLKNTTTNNFKEKINSKFFLPLSTVLSPTNLKKNNSTENNVFFATDATTKFLKTNKKMLFSKNNNNESQILVKNLETGFDKINNMSLNNLNVLSTTTKTNLLLDKSFIPKTDTEKIKHVNVIANKIIKNQTKQTESTNQFLKTSTLQNSNLILSSKYRAFPWYFVVFFGFIVSTLVFSTVYFLFQRCEKYAKKNYTFNKSCESLEQIKNIESECDENINDNQKNYELLNKTSLITKNKKKFPKDYLLFSLFKQNKIKKNNLLKTNVNKNTNDSLASHCTTVTTISTVSSNKKNVSSIKTTPSKSRANEKDLDRELTVIDPLLNKTYSGTIHISSESKTTIQ